MELKINKYLAKPILYLTFIFAKNKFLLVCKGYGEDYDLFTELNWDEDKELDFKDDSQYKDFRIWLK